MQVKSLQYENNEFIVPVGEARSTPAYCQANVGSDSRPRSCGKKMTRRKSGETYCPEHGHMH